MTATRNKPGADIRGASAAQRSEAARLMGSVRTPAKSAATAANISRLNEERKTKGFSEETKAKLREAQQARREREQAEKQAAASLAKAQLPLPLAGDAEKRGPGRPRTKPLIEESEKRGRGRPKKSAEGAGA